MLVEVRKQAGQDGVVHRLGRGAEDLFEEVEQQGRAGSEASLLQVTRGLDAQQFVNGVGKATWELLLPTKGVALVLLFEEGIIAFICAVSESLTHDGPPVQRDELGISLVFELSEVIAEFGVVHVLWSVDIIRFTNAVCGESHGLFNLSGFILPSFAL